MAKLAELVRRFGAWCTRHKIITTFALVAILLAIPSHYLFAGDWTDFATNPLDATAVILGGIIQNITAMIGLITLRIIEVIVIPVLGYNGFYNSHITNLGWALVRDIVNLFVVIVLLVIAIMTIVGYSAANWTQQLPRLFIAIVFVNFSKLICGVFIDFSQVVMFTFVNAIVSIAAGNFAAMLGLSTFGQFGADFIERVNEDGTGVEAFMFLGAAYFQFVIYLAILAVMFLLAVAFIWRIIVLWILIIMSPLAFFAWGIKDIFHSAGSSFSNWMGKFSSALTFGPTLTFFLWLSLAASAGSTLAQTEDFPMPEDANDLNLPLEMFSLDNFLGMFIALALLLAGMQQAAQSAKGMEGFASKFLDPSNGAAAAKWLAKSPFKAATGFKKERAWADQKVQAGAAWTGQFAPTTTKKIGGALAKAGTSMAKDGGFFSSVAGGALAGVGASVAAGAKQAVKEKQKRGLDGFDHQTEDMEMATRLRATAGMSADPVTKEQDLAFRRKMLTDQSARGKHREAMEKSFEEQLKERNKTENLGLSEAQIKTQAKEQAERNYQDTMNNIIRESESDDGKVLYGLSGEEKDKVDDMLTANPMLIQPKGVKRPGEQGYNKAQYDTAQRKAITDHYQKMSDKGRMDIRTIHKGSFADENAQAALKSFMVEGKDGKKSSVWSQIESGGGTIDQRKAMAGLVTAAMVNDPAEGKNNIKTLVATGSVMDERADNRRDAVVDSVRNATASTVDVASHGAAAAAILGHDEGEPSAMKASALFGSNYTALETDAATVNKDTAAQVDAMVESDIASSRHLNEIIKDGTGPSNATSIVGNRISRGAVQRLESQRAAGGPGSKQSGDALQVIQRAVDAELSRPVLDQNYREKLEGIKKEMTVGGRYDPANRKGYGNAGRAPSGAPVVIPVPGGGSSGSAGGGTPPPPPSGGPGGTPPPLPPPPPPSGGPGGPSVKPKGSRLPPRYGGSGSGGTGGGGTPPTTP